MNFSKDLIKKVFSNAQQIFNSKKLILLKCSSQLIVSSSCLNISEKLLVDLKDFLDKTNSCITYCDEYLDKIDNETDFTCDFEDSILFLFDSITSIDKFINDLILETNIIFANISNTNNEQKDETLCNNDDNTILDSSKSSREESPLIEESPMECNAEIVKESILTDNNVLLISEKSKKVFLPYKISDLQDEVKHDKTYTDIQSLISQKYILPIEQFNNAVVSRFKQTYSLCRYKSKRSIYSSIELALELAFNYSLNPAIIAACKNIDELDIYLDFLQENELDKFDLFEIKYEILPR